MTIRTRFAPSPTGALHLGGVRTALFAWAFARKHGGKYFLRIEDTDRQRSTPDNERIILDGLKWLGLTIDGAGEPIRQSERQERYQRAIDELLATGKAYYCDCSPQRLEALREQQRQRGEKPKYDHHCRPQAGEISAQKTNSVIRFCNPLDGVVTWDDAVKGKISIANKELDDLIIRRTDGTPTYNLCVVVDDHDMAISHIIRGDDHVNNTPRQINLINALYPNDKALRYAHVPMVLNARGQKLSKRRDTVNILDYKAKGILPEALLNYLARLGWSHGDDEIFTKDQFIQWFDLEAIHSAPARFDENKLLWLNQHYLQRAELDTLILEVSERLKALSPPINVSEGEDKPCLRQIIELLRPRVNTLQALAAAAIYFYRRPELPQQPLAPEACQVLSDLLPQLMAIAATDWQAERIQQTLEQFRQQQLLSMKQIGLPLRMAVCGNKTSPPLDQTLALIPRAEVLERIRLACEHHAAATPSLE